MDNQTYFNGDFWQCVTATVAGESPASAAAKWRKLRIPKEWRRVLAKLTFANLLELDGQTDKANVHRSAGESLLDELVREAARQESDGRHGSAHLPQGQAVKGSVILDDAYGLMRWDPSDLEDSQKADGRRSLSMALQQVWEAWWWGSLMLLEQEALRPSYADSTYYPAGTEIYFPADGKYYLSVQPVIGVPPASLTNGAYVLNSGFWAESARCYTGNDVDNTLAYAWGSVVRDPASNRFYQRGGSLLASGAGTSGANGIWTVYANASVGTRNVWWMPFSGATTTSFQPQIIAVPTWHIAIFDVSNNFIAGYVQTDSTIALSPDGVQGWTNSGFGPPGVLPGPTFTQTFVAPAPGDAGHWGLLTPFDPVLTIATTVREVARENPTLCRNAQGYAFQPVAGGVRVPGWHCGTAWVWSRRVTPVLTGNDFDSATTYEATEPDELVYDA